MVELLVVMAILLVVTAMAAPNVVDAIANYKLRNSASAVAGLLQQARLQAIRDNSYYTVRSGSIGSAPVAYIDNNPTTPTASDGSGNASYNTGEPVAQLSGTGHFSQSGAPTFNTSSLMGISNVITGDSPFRVSFNSRGLPCQRSGSLCSNLQSGAGNPPVAFVYFLADDRPQNGWAAVSVSPSGRIRVWQYDGSAWK
jgi:Tfp pilus assembly protein FimT